MLSTSIEINGHAVRNRIVMPPMVCFHWADKEGYATHDRGVHYGRRAQGGVGLIVVEASAISPESRIADSMLGIWEDGHIPQFQRVAHSCHQAGSIVIVQLVHAGAKASASKRYSSSPGTGHSAMTLEQIEQLKADFVAAACRAHKAGLDGIEVHGAHGFLLNQFTAAKTNQRTDSYGGNLDKRLRLALEIVTSIRQATDNEFIIGYRYGVNDPTFQEDRYAIQQLTDAGAHMLNVSAGIGWDGLSVPESFPLSPIAYMGTVIHKTATIPTACVGGIREPQQAAYLLENHLTDLVAVGRGLLSDPDWANKALSGEDVDTCFTCKPKCHYLDHGENCPWWREQH